MVFNVASIAVIVVCTVVAFVVGFLARRKIAEKMIKSAESKAKQMLEDIKKEVEDKRKEASLEAKDLLFKIRGDFEKETKERRQELIDLEKRLIQREENLDRKVDVLDKKEKEVVQKENKIVNKEKELENKAKEFDALLAEEKQRLQRVSGLSAEEAKKILISRMEQEARQEAAILMKRIEDEAKETGEKKAKEIITQAIQRCAAEHTVESTVSVVNLPNDDMKGRIIGREGRNIRALEIATGVDVIIDDTPGAVILSAFDVVRREIARIALERLLSDGRIHPGRIEEIVEKVKKEMDVSIKEEGERAAMEAGVHGMHPELIKLVGSNTGQASGRIYCSIPRKSRI